VKAAFAFVHYKGQAGVIAHPDLLSDFRYRLVEKRRDGAQGVRGHPDIRLLLADIDGTLVTQNKVLTEAAKEAARELYDAGIALAITSGRPPRGMSTLIKPLALRGAIAGFNGGVFVNPDLTVIESHTLDPAIAQQTLRLILDQGLHAWIYTEDEWLIREGACNATGFPGRHLERPQGDDCVGYSRHLRGLRRTIRSCQLIAKLPA